MMKLIIKQSFTVFIISFLLLFHTVSFAGADVQTIELGTATKGGGFELFGKTLASV